MTPKPRPLRDPDLTHEYRTVPLGPAPEVRTDDDAIGFTGHAAVFNKRTWIGPSGWGFAEQVAPGAFAKTIGEQDIRFLIDHDPTLLLARNKSGSLRLAEDKIGLDVDADMAPTTYAKDTAILLERGDLSQMSFGFQVVADKWEEVDGKEGNKFELRTLIEVKLFDVSVVTYPAYEDTDASLRSVARALLHRDLDEQARAQLVEALRSPEDPTTAVRSAWTAVRELIDLDRLPRHEPAPVAEPVAAEPEPTTPVTTEPTPTVQPATEDPAAPALSVVLLGHSRGEHHTAPLALCPVCVTRTSPLAA